MAMNGQQFQDNYAGVKDALYSAIHDMDNWAAAKLNANNQLTFDYTAIFNQINTVKANFQTAVENLVAT